MPDRESQPDIDDLIMAIILKVLFEMLCISTMNLVPRRWVDIRLDFAFYSMSIKYNLEGMHHVLILTIFNAFALDVSIPICLNLVPG